MNESWNKLVEWLMNQGYWKALFFVCVSGTCILAITAVAEQIAKHYFP